MKGMPTEICLRLCENTLYAGRRSDDALQEIPIPPAQRGRWRVEEEFIQSIRTGRPVTHTTFTDGVKYMEFTEAVTRSLATDRTVPLPLCLAV